MSQKTFTIKYTSNMKEQEIKVTAKLWKGQRWYVDGLGGTLALDAETGQQIRTHKQVNNPQMISQVQKELGF